MNKFYATIVKGAWTRVLMLMMALFTVTSLFAQAPVRITRFYPDKDAEIQELRYSTTIFITLQNLTDEDICATAMDMRLLQNGEVIGDGNMRSDRLGDMVPNGTAGLGFRVPDCKAVFGNMQPGYVTLQVYGVTYTDAAGVEHHYVDTENDFDEVTYVVKSSATVESTEGFEDGIFRSYYPAEGEAGVLRINISVPIRPDGIHAYLEYGTSNSSATTFLETSLSTDRKTLIIDFRGVARPSYVLAHGKTFTDDEGNVYIPQTVSLNVNGMVADDGAIVESYFVNPSTGAKISFSGAFYSFTYIDETFPNPTLRDAKFFDSAEPDVTYNNIIATTDKLSVKVDNSKYIKYADMVITCGDVVETIPFEQIEKGDDKYIVTLPESIRKAGSANMVISLTNVEFTEFDGVDHKIEPLDLAGALTEVFSLDEVKALEIGTKFILNSQDLTVTFSKAGYIFMEDLSAGVRLIGDDANALETGVRLFGKFAGSYQGGNTVNFIADKSNLTTSTSNIVEGVVLFDKADLTDQFFQCRYVTVVASNAIPVVAQDGMLLIGDGVIGVLDLYEFEVPETIESVTGVLYEMSGTTLLIVTDFNILHSGEDLPVFTTFAELLEAQPEGEVLLDLNHAVVTFCDAFGEFYIQDETGALGMAEVNDGEVPQRGTVLDGQVKGSYFPSINAFLYDAQDLVVNYSEADVTVGTRVNSEMILSGDYNYRLVTVYFEDEPIIRDAENFGAVIGSENPVYIVDFFDVIEDWNWKFPMGSKQVTGLVYPLTSMLMDEDGDEFTQEETYFLAIRDAQDVVSLDTLDSLKDVRLDAQNGEAYIVNLTDTKVIYTIDEAYIAEDATAGMMIFSEDQPLEMGTLINGTMVAIYDETAGLITTADWCQFDLSTCDVATGINMTAEEIFDPMNDCRLVTLTTEDHSIEFVEDGAYFIDEQVLAALLEYDAETPENVKQITGVVFRDYASEDEKEFGDAVIIIRTPEDIVADNGTTGVENVTTEMQSGAIYNLQGIQVRPNSDNLQGLKGIYIVDGKKVMIK